MSRQRGVVLLMALGLSLLLGLLAAQVLHEAQARQRLVSKQLAVARAFEQAEAGLLEGAALLPGALPPLCVSCLPPAIPPQAPMQPWQQTASGFVFLQHLGSTERAAGLPHGEPVTLVRVTAISSEARARQVLEAVYALDASATLRRVSWRQRLQEG